MAPALWPSWSSLSPAGPEAPSPSPQAPQAASRPGITPCEPPSSASLLPAPASLSDELQHHRGAHCRCPQPGGKGVAGTRAGLGRGECLGKLKIGRLDSGGSGHQGLAGVTSQYLAEGTLYFYFSAF